MTYKPTPSKKQRVLSALFVVFSVVVWTLGSLSYNGQELPYRGLIQLAAIMMMVCGLQVMVRYALSEFRYILEDKENGDTDLLIYKRQGERDTKVCHVSLYNVITLFKYGEIADYQSRYGKVDNRFNYCQNMGKENMYLILYRDDDKLIEIRFEPDKEFADEIKRRLPLQRGGDQDFAM